MIQEVISNAKTRYLSLSNYYNLLHRIEFIIPTPKQARRISNSSHTLP